MIEKVNKNLPICVFYVLPEKTIITGEDKMEEAKIKVLFGLRIKELRKAKRLSQDVLSEKADLSSKYISRIEMGQHFPSINTLIKLAEVLDVELKDFFEFTHGEESPKKLKDNLKRIIKEADYDKLKLLVKVGRAIVK